MPTGDDLVVGIGTSANNPTVLLASVDDDGGSSFPLARGIFEAGPTDNPNDVPASPFIGLLGRGAAGRYRNVAGAAPPMPGVVGFGGKSSGFDTDHQGGTGVLGIGGGTEYDFPVPKVAAKDQPGPGLVGVGGQGHPSGGFGAGVVGVSGTDLTGPLPQLPDPADTVNIGVYGQSQSGPGIVGKSQADRGGVFSAGVNLGNPIAQLRVVPQPVPPSPNPPTGLPKDGKPGDLFTRQVIGANRETETELWFCIREPRDSSTAMWGRIAFDSTQFA
jgi:hypothetical protein